MLRGAGRNAAAQSAPYGTGAAVDVCKRAQPRYGLFFSASSADTRRLGIGHPGDKAEQARGHGSKSVREWVKEPLSPRGSEPVRRSRR